jgi:uncharacterized iron-regulated membrane protein
MRLSLILFPAPVRERILMKFRKIIFWLHLACGVTAGLVILVMSVTGVLLTYERQITAWADRPRAATQPSTAAARLPIEAIVAAAATPPSSDAGGASAAPPSAITLRADSSDPVAVNFGRGRTVFVDPYTGANLGEGSQRTRAFFRSVTEWHRFLAVGGDRRATARAVTGACNLAFLFLVVSGVYLWWPRSWRGLRAVTVFTPGLRGKARDWNWHNVLGVWSALPLLIVVASGVVISYPWASDLLYRAVGETPPARNAPGAGSPTRPGGERGDRGESREGGPRRARPEGDRRELAQGGARGREGRRTETGDAASTTRPSSSAALAGVDAALDRVRQESPGWRSITLQLPRTPDAPVAVAVDRGTGGQPQKRAQLTVDRATAAVTTSDTFASQSLGRRLRSIARFAHTGEVLGLPGQTVAGLASAAASVLVYTGFSLTWRRFRARRRGNVGTTNGHE